MAIKVYLRQKPIKRGRLSLYLDFWPEITDPTTGKATRRQFLGMYVFKSPKNPLDREHNKETLIRAELIRQKRDNELNKPEIYSGFEREQLRLKGLSSQSFKEYFAKIAARRSGTTRSSWDLTLQHLNDFAPEDLMFSDITESFCEDFRSYLLTTPAKRSLIEGGKLGQNTAVLYFSKFKTALRQAYKDGLLQVDLSTRVDGIPKHDVKRITMTLDEVNALVRAECSIPVLKRAAIFSAYTGLRFSDIHKLTWGEIEERSPDNYVIAFKQKKTKSEEVQPVPREAVRLLGERRADELPVFEGLKYSAHWNNILSKWVKAAGITKDVTFHTFRHTFATLQLTFGTDLYTVSKLLGHKDIKTTQIYAKIVDEAKRTAAERITLDIGNWK